MRQHLCLPPFSPLSPSSSSPRTHQANQHQPCLEAPALDSKNARRALDHCSTVPGNRAKLAPTLQEVASRHQPFRPSCFSSHLSYYLSLGKATLSRHEADSSQ